MEKVPVSVCIVTYNEEEKILECLKSIEWAKEIVVVDSFSSDKTIETCRRFTDKIFQRKWSGYIGQKNFALSKATQDWALSIDADERPSLLLIEEIRKELFPPSQRYSGFIFRRHTYYLGRWINHAGWYPDYKLRLFKRDKGYFGGREPHDKVILQGKAKKLRGELKHFTYKDIGEHLEKINSFSTTTAESKRREKERYIWLKLLFKPPYKFFEVYVLKAGFLDGWAGFIISAISAFQTFLTYAKTGEYRWMKKKDKIK